MGEGGERVWYQLLEHVPIFPEFFWNPDTSLRTSVALNATTRVLPLGLKAVVTFSLGKLGLESIAMKEQRSAINAIYKFLCVRLSTGYGKSLCYQTLPFVMDHEFGLTGSASQ